MGRILVVDDEEGVRAFVSESLLRAGHDTIQAGSGEEALARLEESAFDLMLTDLKMPGMPGLELVKRARLSWPDLEVLVLTAYGSVETAVDAMKLGASEFLQKPIASPSELRAIVERNLTLRAEPRTAPAPLGEPALSYGDPVMRPVLAALGQVAPTRASVLLLGESGTGKGLLAKAIHSRSAQASGPFVAINCASIPSQLLESELFGHEKGAFTGAHAQRRGRLEMASGGTFFLDEIGELHPELQAKLLRVVEERSFERVGGTRTLTADVRFVAATHRDLTKAVAERRFREDLYHRLAVFPIQVPPLAKRRTDLLPLAESLLDEVVRSLARPPMTLSWEARRAIEAHAWPGNVRELRNALERAAIVTSASEIPAAALRIEMLGAKESSPASAALDGSLESLEVAAIRRALDRHDGNRRRAAEQLGIGLRTLYEKLKRYQLD